MGVKLSVLGSATQVEMIQTAVPGGICRQACVHCGASDSKDKGPQLQLTREQLRENLIQEVSNGVKGKIVANYLAPFPTTGVDVEPTDGDAFNDAAELVYELTEGKSRMICISHGVREYIDLISGEKKDEVVEIFKLFSAEQRRNVNIEGCLSSLRSFGISAAIVEEIQKMCANLLDYGERLGLRLDLIEELLGLDLVKKKVSTQDSASAGRMAKTVELIKEGKVAGMVLTVDVARSGGKIRPENNVASYVKSLNLLKPALADDCPGFVAVSIQGLHGDNVPPDHPYSYERALLVFNEALARSSLTDDERARIRYDEPRNYVKAGRAGEDPALADFIGDTNACEVVPFKEFVDRVIAPSRRGKILRAKVNADGTLAHQLIRPGRTYNTTVEGPWSTFADVAPLREFVAANISRALAGEVGPPLRRRVASHSVAKRRETSWEDEITDENDIFEIKPFSALRVQDMADFLAYLRTRLGVSNLCDYRLEDSKSGGSRPLRFADLKMEILHVLYPENNLDRKIHDASPYKEIVDHISATGEAAGVLLDSHAFWTGQIMAIAKGIEETFPGINYLVAALSEMKPVSGRRGVRVARRVNA